MSWEVALKHAGRFSAEGAMVEAYGMIFDEEGKESRKRSRVNEYQASLCWEEKS